MDMALHNLARADWQRTFPEFFPSGIPAKITTNA
jgi:hypothetical protein